MKVAVVGCTGLVGSVMLKVLTERDFPVTMLIPVASQKNVGKEIVFNDETWEIQSIDSAIEQRPDIALFSAGAKTSLEYAPIFAKGGCVVIDNSSAWRMDPDKKLVVPEVNGDVLNRHDKIIANPNCSTIQMVVSLKPLHDRYKIKRIVVSTYQSVTGTGVKAFKQLMNERDHQTGEMAYPYQIDLNAIPQCDVFLENGYTKEEMKMILETPKIMGDDTIKITSTTVRIPVTGGHSESINVEFEHDFDLQEVRELLKNAPGVILQDDPKAQKYPMPLFAEGKDDVFVGRLRRDNSQPRTLNMWVVSDNLRKGAATNSIQIAEYLLAEKLLENSIYVPLH